ASRGCHAFAAYVTQSLSPRVDRPPKDARLQPLASGRETNLGGGNMLSRPAGLGRQPTSVRGRERMAPGADVHLVIRYFNVQIWAKRNLGRPADALLVRRRVLNALGKGDVYSGRP